MSYRKLRSLLLYHFVSGYLIKQDIWVSTRWLTFRPRNESGLCRIPWISWETDSRSSRVITPLLLIEPHFPWYSPKQYATLPEPETSHLSRHPNNLIQICFNAIIPSTSVSSKLIFYRTNFEIKDSEWFLFYPVLSVFSRRPRLHLVASPKWQTQIMEVFIAHLHHPPVPAFSFCPCLWWMDN